MADSEGFAQPWLDFEEQIGTRLLIHGPIDQVNKQFEHIRSVLVTHLTYPPPDLSVKTEDREISSGLKVRIYTPPNYVGNKPVCLFCHGGGWALGDLDVEDPQVRTISKAAGVVIVSVEYRLAPAHPYPAPLNDCVTAYYWALNNHESLKTTPNQVVTFGTSAGGNLALSTALKVIDEGRGDTLKGVAAVVPATIDPDAVPKSLKSKYTSYEEHAEHTINTGWGMKAFFDGYKGPPEDPYVSPLLHTRLKLLPKVYIAVCEQDTLRDDGKLLKVALDEARVPNLYDEYAGYPHWFWAFPSEHLAEPIAAYDKNLNQGFEFILS